MTEEERTAGLWDPQEKVCEAALGVDESYKDNGWSWRSSGLRGHGYWEACIHVMDVEDFYDDIKSWDGEEGWGEKEPQEDRYSEGTERQISGSSSDLGGSMLEQWLGKRGVKEPMTLIMSLMCSAFIKSFLIHEESLNILAQYILIASSPTSTLSSLTEQLEVTPVHTSLLLHHTILPISNVCPSSHSCKDPYNLIQMSYFSKFFLECLSHFGGNIYWTSTVRRL